MKEQKETPKITLMDVRMEEGGWIGLIELAKYIGPHAVAPCRGVLKITFEPDDVREL